MLCHLGDQGETIQGSLIDTTHLGKKVASAFQFQTNPQKLEKERIKLHDVTDSNEHSRQNV